jgi:hypothetical protein
MVGGGGDAAQVEAELHGFSLDVGCGHRRFTLYSGQEGTCGDEHSG